MRESRPPTIATVVLCLDYPLLCVRCACVQCSVHATLCCAQPRMNWRLSLPPRLPLTAVKKRGVETAGRLAAGGLVLLEGARWRAVLLLMLLVFVLVETQQRKGRAPCDKFWLSLIVRLSDNYISS